MSIVANQPDVTPSITPPVPPPEPIPGTAPTGQFLFNPDGTLHVGPDGRVRVNDPDGELCCGECSESNNPCFAYCETHTPQRFRLTFSDIDVPVLCRNIYGPPITFSMRIEVPGGWDPNQSFDCEQAAGHPCVWQTDAIPLFIRVHTYFGLNCQGTPATIEYHYVRVGIFPSGPYYAHVLQASYYPSPLWEDTGRVFFFRHWQTGMWPRPDCFEPLALHNDCWCDGCNCIAFDGSVAIICLPSREGGGARAQPGGSPNYQASFADQRAAYCKGCDEFGMFCEEEFPHGRCDCGWMSWLANPTSKCPLDKWPSASSLAAAAGSG